MFSITSRKYVSFDPLIQAIQHGAQQIPDHRQAQPDYSITEAVMSGIAMFSLKDPSLLAFQERRNDQNMKNIYRIENVPSDTQMREILDPIDPDQLRPLFQDVFRNVQRAGALQPFVFHEGVYLLSLDGTEYYSSKKVHCPSCLQRKHANGQVTYYHQMVGAVLVHPDVLVNFLRYTESNAQGDRVARFSWVTDLTITEENAWHLVRGGRARWKVENETFNTLKNQGYQFEHNFGHGRENLSVVFAMLMMLAFLVDQVQELCCGVFQAVRAKFTSRRSVWDHIRSHFRHFVFESMEHLYAVLLSDCATNLPAPQCARQFARPPT